PSRVRNHNGVVTGIGRLSVGHREARSRSTGYVLLIVSPLIAERLCANGRDAEDHIVSGSHGARLRLSGQRWRLIRREVDRDLSWHPTARQHVQELVRHFQRLGVIVDCYRTGIARIPYRAKTKEKDGRAVSEGFARSVGVVPGNDERAVRDKWGANPDA